jgi:membrane-associated protease RseP (regulator of RpoE activity)
MTEIIDRKFNQTNQTYFEKLTATVSEEFQIEEALIEHNIPTYYLKQPQETKQAFIRLLKKLEAMNLVAILRRVDRRIVLKLVPKPPAKPSKVLVNWLLFFATIGTTFLTGYILSKSLKDIGGAIDPLVGGAAFTIAIMAVFGTHEMGHKLTANKEGIEATPPYFIPGPPPNLGGFGTFGAVIMQKSLPPNKDSLFDVGASGPLVGFIVATIVAAVGITMAIPIYPTPPPEKFTILPTPLIMILISRLMLNFGIISLPSSGGLFMHPVEFAGWVGMLVTVLNLFPAAMLDGGHVARSLAGEKTRIALTMLSIFLMILSGFWLMAMFVLFMAMQRHPGPLDDVSSLSKSRKLLAVILIAIFVLSFPLF